MSLSKIEEMYDSMRAFIRLAVENEVAKQKPEVRAVPELNYDEVERRVWEKIVPKLPAPPTFTPPKDGKDGENGKDGIGTREEIEAIVERKVSEVQVRTFADIYKGVYVPDTLYTRGVLTTWGGSLFLSRTDTKAKPGESPDWQLVVKRGSDGRDVSSRR